MDLTLERDGRTLWLKFDGELESLQDKKLKSIMKEINKSDKPRVVLDFAAVKTISSEGIGKLLELYKATRKNDGLMEIAAMSYNLKETFKLLKLDLVLHLSGMKDTDSVATTGETGKDSGE